MKFNDTRWELFVADTAVNPLETISLPLKKMLPEELGLILSASGWRGIFASGDEDSSPEPRTEMRAAALAMAAAAGEFFLSAGEKVQNKKVVIGCDARPTGPLIADIFLRVFTSLQIPVEYLFITAAPEIMAAARDSDRCSGFCYISASHNPVGHNGVKIGTTDGGVLPASEAAGLITRIKQLLADPEELSRYLLMAGTADIQQLEKLYAGYEEAKTRAVVSYESFSRRVVFDDYPQAEDILRRTLADEPLGVIGELNGSARGASIDADFFSSLGVSIRLFNRRPGDIRHRILPEGEALFPCRELLEEAWDRDAAFQIGYVPDNDGDRGNIVYIDPADGKGHVLEAQEVFALSCLAELACSRLFSAGSGNPDAVAVNGPTSLRIDALAAKFDAQVFRAEVGEANVVNLARELRSQGFRVRILGEGSNGGTITHPAAVRDPLNTVSALVKLLRLRSSDGTTPAESWLKLNGEELKAGEAASIPRLLASLPAYQTTPTGEDRAKFPVRSTDHDLLKSRYERTFTESWRERPDLLHTMGISSYRFVNYEGTSRRPGPGNRTGSGKGGFKVELLDAQETPRAFLWMRGSGTEPVFRVMVDLPGNNPADESTLMDWHRRILSRADAAD